MNSKISNVDFRTNTIKTTKDLAYNLIIIHNTNFLLASETQLYYPTLFNHVYFKEPGVKTVLPHVTLHCHLDSHGAVATLDVK
jgi:hypothetical protein